MAAMSRSSLLLTLAVVAALLAVLAGAPVPR